MVLPSKMSLEDTRQMEQALWDLIEERAPGYEPQAAAMIRQLRMRGQVPHAFTHPDPGMGHEVIDRLGARPWTIDRSTLWPEGIGLEGQNVYRTDSLQDRLQGLRRELGGQAEDLIHERAAQGLGLPPRTQTLARHYRDLAPGPGQLLMELHNVGGHVPRISDMPFYWDLPGVRSPEVMDLLNRFGMRSNEQAVDRLLDLLTGTRPPGPVREYLHLGGPAQDLLAHHGWDYGNPSLMDSGVYRAEAIGGMPLEQILRILRSGGNP
jgi:hypothetical protein